MSFSINVGWLVFLVLPALRFVVPAAVHDRLMFLWLQFDCSEGQLSAVVGAVLVLALLWWRYEHRKLNRLMGKLRALRDPSRSPSDTQERP